MQITDNVLRYYLRNCYFINGTAYAGKSTMCAMLAQRFDMIHCGENYAMDNFRACIARINSPENYQAWLNSGFYTLIREDDVQDTREETLQKLAKHFRLI